MPEMTIPQSEKAHPAVSTGAVLPNFFIVGAAKGGTTSIYAHLKEHPQVFFPEVKEPGHFATCAPAGAPRVATGRCRTREEYQQLYSSAGNHPAIGDASTSYLWDENAPLRIRDACPGARIIIMLRDPVLRAHSYYLMHLRCGGETAGSFREALERDQARNKTSWFTSWQYVEAGLYYAQVKRYLETFGSEQVLIRLFDDLARDPVGLFESIAKHIRIDPCLFTATDLSEAHNAFKWPRATSLFRWARSPRIRKLRQRFLPDSLQEWLRNSPILYGTRKPPLDEESRRYLQKIYDPDISCLEELIGRKLPELRKSWT